MTYKLTTILMILQTVICATSQQSIGMYPNELTCDLSVLSLMDFLHSQRCVQFIFGDE